MIAGRRSPVIRHALLACACFALFCAEARAQANVLLYVPNQNDDNVSVYTANANGTLTAAGTIAVGDFPNYMAIRGDQAFAYVTNSAGVPGNLNRSISVIDTKTQTVGQTVTVTIASSMFGVAVSPNGSTVYAAVRSTLTNTVRVFSADPATGQLTPTATINTGFSPRGIVLNRDGSRLYVVNQASNTVSVIDTGTNTVIATIPVGNQPLNIAINPAGTRLYVTNFTSNSVSVINIATETVVATVPTGNGPNGVAVTPDGAHFYVAEQTDQTVAQFATATNTSIAPPIASAQTTSDIQISPDGTFLYATNSSNSDNVTMYTIAAGTGVLTANGSIASGNNPHFGAVCDNGNAMLATGAIFRANTAGALGCAQPSPAFSGGTLLVNNPGLTFTQSFDLGTGGGTIDTNGNDATFSGAFTGANALTKAGTGILTFSGGSNTYSGTTTVSGGTLMAGAAGTFSPSSAITVGGSGTLALNNLAQTIASLAGSGPVTLGSATLTAGGDNTTTTYSGAISGTGGFTKSGSGTLTLSGTNAYTGATTVSAGTLLVNGSTAAGTTVTVAGGATLGGSGTINGNVVLQPCSTLLAGVTVNGSITGAATSVSVAPSAATVTYATTQTFTATVTSGACAVTAGSVTFVDTTTATTLASGVALNGSGQAATTALLGAGGHTIQATYSPDLSHAGSSNTTGVTVNTASLTVTADALTISYGTTPSHTATMTGFVNGDTAAVVSGTAAFSTNATLTNGKPDAGSWTATPAVGTLAAANYAFTFAPGTLTVNKVALTVTADALTTTYGTAPAFTASYTGFVNGDTSSVVSGTASFTTNATTTAGLPNAGTWTITPSAGTLAAANYTFGGFATGTLTVGKANQTITFGALGTKILGSAPFGVGATGGGSGNPVTFSSTTTGVCTVASSTVTLVALGTCTIAADQAGDANYNAATRVTQSFLVAPVCSVSLAPAQLGVALTAIPYSQALTLTNGAAPVTFTLSGALPAGVTFTNGAFSGTPAARGAFAVTATATDANGCQATASYSLAVSAERRLLVATGAGVAGAVRAFNIASGTARANITPYGSFDGGVSVAQGDTNGDGLPDTITGAGPGGAPHIQVVDGSSGQVRLSFFAFDPGFRGGVEVAAGDVTGDGLPDILAVSGCAPTFQVRAFNGITGALVRDYPFTPSSWSCGLHVAAGDVNGDGIADVIAGSGGVGAPFVSVIDGASGALIRELLPYPAGFTGGVYVAAGDVNGDGYADIVTGAGPGGGPHVRVFDGQTGAQIAGALGSFMAYPGAFLGGVRVAAGDLNGDGRAEVITGAGPGGGPHLRVWDGATATEIYGLYAFDPGFSGGLFVGGPSPAARMNIDIPAPRTTGTGVRIAGWALREIATDTGGTDAIHAWAYPVAGGAPVFVGAAPSRTARPDVAAFFGGEFLMSGFDFTGTLAAGTYDLVVFARNSRTLRFDQARAVRVTVQ